MRRSPFRNHQIAVRATLAIDRGSSDDIAPERADDSPEAGEYALLLAALGNDLRQLQDIQSTEQKIAAKRTMIGQYMPHVEATLQAADLTGKAVQDEVLVYMMIWLFDIGSWAIALDIAEHVLRYGLALPSRFQRTAATLVAEEVAEGALATLRQEQDFLLPHLQRALGLTEGRDMPDIVQAKLHKALGLQFLREATAAEEKSDGPAGAPVSARRQALQHFQRALALDKKIGVKKDIERVTVLLNKAAPDDETSDDETAET